MTQSPGSPSSVPNATPDSASNSNNDGGLSTGGKVGIGVAGPLGLLLLAALAFFILKSRKQKRAISDLQRRNRERRGDTYDSGAAKDATVHGHGYVPEVGGDGMHELGGDGRYEMAGIGLYDLRHELSD